MRIYEPQPVYSSKSGKPTGKHSYELTHHACDYCGALIEAEDGFQEREIAASYAITQLLDMEETWYYLDAPKTPDGKGVSTRSVFSEEAGDFVYCPDCEVHMALEWAGTLRNGTSPLRPEAMKDTRKFLKDNDLGKPFSEMMPHLHDMMCEARLRVVAKLLKTYPPEALQLEREP